MCYGFKVEAENKFKLRPRENRTRLMNCWSQDLGNIGAQVFSCFGFDTFI